MIPWKVWLLVANVTPRFCLHSRHHLGKNPICKNIFCLCLDLFLEMPLPANSFSWPSGARGWDGHRGQHSALLAGIILTLNLAKTCLPDNYNKHCEVIISCSNIHREVGNRGHPAYVSHSKIIKSYNFTRDTIPDLHHLLSMWYM